MLVYRAIGLTLAGIRQMETLWDGRFCTNSCAKSFDRIPDMA